tara:strand:+ start:245 stop:505 length:261 start_codon:yes stop_codon:yes gene_type:complete
MIFTIGKSFEDRARDCNAQDAKLRKEMSAWQKCFRCLPVQVGSEYEWHSNQWAFMQWVYCKKVHYRGDRYMWIYSLTDLTPMEDNK